MLFDLIYQLAGNADFYSDNIEPLFRATDQGPAARFVKDAWYFTPMAGCVHLVALSLLGGAILLADLRVVGPGVTARSPVELNRKMHPFLVGAAIALIISGIMLGLGQVMRIYNSPPFWLKMAGLFSALVFTFTTRDSVIRNNGKFTPVAIIGLVISMLVFWYAWIELTDWRYAARQAYLILMLLIVGFITAPMYLKNEKVEKLRALPMYISLPGFLVVVGALISAAFLLARIDYQYFHELDLNAMGIAAFFHPSILGMMLVSYIAGVISWIGMGAVQTQPLNMRFVSMMSMFLWLSVAISGRWIAFW